jgi:AAA+ ATPase superfamily predicted ATPase
VLSLWNDNWQRAKQAISRSVFGTARDALPSCVLVIGPSSVGKSTLIASPLFVHLGLERPRIVYGTDLVAANVPPQSVVHYNMLHQVQHAKGVRNATEAGWDYTTEPVFKKIVTSGLIQHCVVLVAPIKEIIERIERRKVIEDLNPRRYNRELWIEAMRSLDLVELYNKLFAELDRAGIPFVVLFSSGQADPRFLPTSREDVGANLQGIYSDAAAD